ncbi:hypothetical protein MRBLMI12_000523 [Microbacterium sp. LMI12-1-1.1]|uniref:hypothetical protein n=1 Tax=Microbacterium sp. LMI12-1-1.1 TaxID=3135225 RepID=UPI003427D617
MPDPRRFMKMEEMVEESGISRFTLMPALQEGRLHGIQHVPRGKWRVERTCFEAWLTGEECSHQKAKKEAKAA